MTPLKAIRRYCLWCANDQAQEVNLCPAARCPLHSYRFGKTPVVPNPSPLGAIRKRCLDCVAGSYQDVATCATASCALNMFRFGKNPNYGERKRTGARGVIRRLREKLPDDDAIERSKSESR
jgi:hypothetical protein